MKSIYFAIIIFFALGCKPKQNAKMPAYKKEDLKSFITTYSYILDHPFNPLLSAEKNSPKINISYDRLSEIFQNQFADNLDSISPSEKIELDKLKDLVTIDKEQYDNMIRAKMTNSKISDSLFDSIKKDYNSNTKFQRKVNKLNTKMNK